MDEFDLVEKNLKFFMLQYCPWVSMSHLLPMLTRIIIASLEIN